MHSIFILALVSVTWVLFGFTLAFGKDVGGWGIIGGLDYIGLHGVGKEPLTQYAPTIPGSAFMAFQMMFAVITPALITGAFAERKRFKAFVLFSLLWTLFVYSPIAHWVWGEGGWLRNLGALDFAGGTVVHISSGVAALVAALVLGPRVKRESDRFEPHDVRLTVNRRRLALVRLVRVQRRLRPGGQRHRGQRLRRNQHRGGHGGPDLGHGQLAAQGHAERRRGRWRAEWPVSWPSRRRRLRRRQCRDHHRLRRGRDLLRAPSCCASGSRSTTRSTSGPSTASAGRSARS